MPTCLTSLPPHTPAGGPSRVCGHQGNSGAARQADGEVLGRAGNGAPQGGGWHPGASSGGGRHPEGGVRHPGASSGQLPIRPGAIDGPRQLFLLGCLHPVLPMLPMHAPHAASICSAFTVPHLCMSNVHLQEAGPIISFDFRKLHFILDSEDLTFRKLKYPTKVRLAGTGQLHRSSSSSGRCSTLPLAAGVLRFGPPASCPASKTALRLPCPARVASRCTCKFLPSHRVLASELLTRLCCAAPMCLLQETFAAYRASSGYTSEGKLVAALEKWGPNKFEVGSAWRQFSW